MCSNRLKNLRAVLEDNGAEIALIFDPADIYYVTCGLGSGGLLYVDQASAAWFIPPVDYAEVAAKETGPDFDLRCIDKKIPWAEIGLMCADRVPALDPARISLAHASRIRSCCAAPVVEIEGMILKLRTVKEPSEIEKIARACKITSDILGSLSPSDWIGKTEADLASWLASKSWENGCSGFAFLPVVASHANSAYPHHRPASGAVIEKGWLKVDYGVVCEGYCSDLTRTYILDTFFNGLNSEDLLEILKAAREKAVGLMKPGVRCADVYNAAKEVLNGYGYGDNFIHGLGHGIGIEIHEPPYLSSGNEEELAEDMIVTIEPGIYFEGTGGMRLEDVYRITKGGNEPLSRI